ncbi:unnamed protein product, partial [Heterotrigona itama]
LQTSSDTLWKIAISMYILEIFLIIVTVVVIIFEVNTISGIDTVKSKITELSGDICYLDYNYVFRTISLYKSRRILSNVTLLLLSNDASANDRRLKRHFDLFLRDDIVGRRLNAAALITAVPPPELGMIAAAVGRASGVSASFLRRFLLFLPVGTKAAKPEESLPELRGHQIVQNWVDGGVQVEHHPAEVEQGEVTLDTEVDDHFDWDDQDPKRQRSKWQQAQEETEHHCAEHQHHLFAVFEQVVRRAAADRRVRH